jgi:hypothetical protein
MSTSWALPLFVVLSVGAAPTFARASVLSNTARPVLWSGTVTAGAGPVGEVPECATGCARFDVNVNLPANAWHDPGGVQFAIRWTSRTLGDNLKMFVYRGGVLIAKSDGIISTAQSVLVREPANGVFNVYVAHDPDSPNSTIDYDGLAEVEYGARPNPARILAPDLEVRPHRNLGFDPGGIFFDAISEAHPTCYQSEVDEEGAKTCLRFDQIFANVGEGPLELRFMVPTETRPSAVTAVQRRYSSDPAVAPEDEPVGAVVYHPVHDHYHFASFGISRLWAVDASKNKVRVVRERAQKRMFENAVVRSGRKVSFCLADIEIDSWAQKGDAARKYNAPDCLFPTSSDGTTDTYVQGISNGWADVYDWYLPDQYMEVTGVPDGTYLLETTADPDNLLRETDETNNCGGVFLRLTGVATSTPSVELLGAAMKCAR